MSGAKPDESFEDRIRQADAFVKRERRPGIVRGYRVVGQNVRLIVRKQITSDNVETLPENPHDLPF